MLRGIFQGTGGNSAQRPRRTPSRHLRRVTIFSTLLVFAAICLMRSPTERVSVSAAEIHYPDKIGDCKYRRRASCMQGTQSEFFDRKKAAQRHVLEGLGLHCQDLVLRPDEPCPKKDEPVVPAEPETSKPCEEELPQFIKDLLDFLRDTAQVILEGAAESANLIDKISSQFISISSTHRCAPAIDLHSTLIPTKCPTSAFKCSPMAPCQPDTDPAPNSSLPFVVAIAYPIMQPVESDIYSPDPKVAKEARDKYKKEQNLGLNQV